MVQKIMRKVKKKLEKFPELESYFQKLTDATDNVAAINTHYEADHNKDFEILEGIFTDIQSHEWEKTEPSYFNLFTSYYTFHVKIIEEIIREAREILNSEKREYVKRLVNYKKQADEWFLNLKKKRKAKSVAA